LRGRDNHSPRPSGNPMPVKKFVAVFCEITSQGISAIVAVRRGAPLACVAHKSSKEQILASAPRNISRPPTGAASTDVGHQDFRLDGKKGGYPVRFSARPCNVTRLSHSISRGRRPVNSFIASRLYSADASLL